MEWKITYFSWFLIISALEIFDIFSFKLLWWNLGFDAFLRWNHKPLSNNNDEQNCYNANFLNAITATNMFFLLAISNHGILALNSSVSYNAWVTWYGNNFSKWLQWKNVRLYLIIWQLIIFDKFTFSMQILILFSVANLLEEQDSEFG